MNKPIDKWMTNEVKKATDALDGFSNLFVMLIDGYVNPDTRYTDYGKGIRRVVTAGKINYEAPQPNDPNGKVTWSFTKPTVTQVMCMRDTYNVYVTDELVVDLRRLLKDPRYLESFSTNPSFDILVSFLEELDGALSLFAMRMVLKEI